MTYSYDDNPEDIQEESNKPGFFTIIILLLLLASMLASLMWPFLQRPTVRYRPTPTSIFLQEA